MHCEIEEHTLDAFSEHSFSVQDFMSAISEKKDLSQILQALVTWRNQNASKMSTVLKEQTDAVISIAEDVQALHQRVENVTGPISQLFEEMIAMDKTIIEIVTAYAAKVNADVKVRTHNFHIHCVRAYGIMLRLTRELMSHIEYTDEDASLLLQRVINLYINHSSYIKKLDILLSDPPIEDVMSDLISKIFLRSYNRKQIELTKSTVLCAQHLNQSDWIQNIICDHIVKPKMQPILCDTHLHQLNGAIEVLFTEAFNILDKDFKIFLNRDIFDFDFIYECYWPVADGLMRENLLSITDAGHPDAFFINFTATSKFIQKLIDNYGFESEHNYDSFKDHLTRFSLYVYYEIRHQHCAHVFETSIMQLTGAIVQNRNLKFNEEYKLTELNTSVSIALNTQLQYMFNENVFLLPLMDQFMKLSMSLITRYINWINITFVNNNSSIGLSDKYSYLQLLCDLTYFMDNRVGFQSKNELDLKTKSIYAPAVEAFTEDLWGILFYNYEILHTLYDNLEKKFINEICDEINVLLKNMFSIPRLYRRTNRSVPTEHSNYIDTAVEVVLKIHKYYNGSKAVVKSVCMDLIEKIIMSACMSMKIIILELISSINKTESSLRRLKNRNATSATGDDPVANTNSDEYKIRMQVNLDVKQFVSKLKPSLQNESQLIVLQELVVLVE